MYLVLKSEKGSLEETDHPTMHIAEDIDTQLTRINETIAAIEGIMSIDRLRSNKNMTDQSSMMPPLEHSSDLEHNSVDPRNSTFDIVPLAHENTPVNNHVKYDASADSGAIDTTVAASMDDKKSVQIFIPYIDEEDNSAVVIVSTGSRIEESGVDAVLSSFQVDKRSEPMPHSNQHSEMNTSRDDSIISVRAAPIPNIESHGEIIRYLANDNEAVKDSEGPSILDEAVKDSEGPSILDEAVKDSEGPSILDEAVKDSEGPSILDINEASYYVDIPRHPSQFSTESKNAIVDQIHGDEDTIISNAQTNATPPSLASVPQEYYESSPINTSTPAPSSRPFKALMARHKQEQQQLLIKENPVTLCPTTRAMSSSAVDHDDDDDDDDDDDVQQEKLFIYKTSLAPAASTSMDPITISHPMVISSVVIEPTAISLDDSSGRSPTAAYTAITTIKAESFSETPEVTIDRSVVQQSRDNDLPQHDNKDDKVQQPRSSTIALSTSSPLRIASVHKDKIPSESLVTVMHAIVSQAESPEGNSVVMEIFDEPTVVTEDDTQSVKHVELSPTAIATIVPFATSNQLLNEYSSESPQSEEHHDQSPLSELNANVTNAVIPSSHSLHLALSLQLDEDVKATTDGSLSHPLSVQLDEDVKATTGGSLSHPLSLQVDEDVKATTGGSLSHPLSLIESSPMSVQDTNKSSSKHLQPVQSVTQVQNTTDSAKGKALHNLRNYRKASPISKQGSSEGSDHNHNDNSNRNQNQPSNNRQDLQQSQSKTQRLICSKIVFKNLKRVEYFGRYDIYIVLSIGKQVITMLC